MQVVVVSRFDKLLPLVRVGAVLVTLGNGLVTSLGFYDSTWKYLAFIFPANLGQGIIYSAVLFTTLASFDHSGKCSCYMYGRADPCTDHAVSTSTVYLVGQCMWRSYYGFHSPEHT